MKEKKCPVDRERLLIALEYCWRHKSTKCVECPYWKLEDGCAEQSKDALAYIGWLEEQLKERGDDVLG